MLTELDRGGPSAGEAGAAALAGAGNALGLLAFYRAAAVGPLSIAAPLGSLGALVPVLVGVAHGEGVGGLKLLAIALAMTGVALAARRSPAAPAADGRRPPRRGGLGARVLRRLRHLPRRHGAGRRAGIFWAVAISRVALLAIFVAVALRLASPLRVGGHDVPRVMVPGLLLFGGTLLYTAATREGDLSVVAVLGSLFPVVTVGLAFALLGERLSRMQGVGAVAAMLGRRAARGGALSVPFGARLCDECVEGAGERRLVREGVRGVGAFRDTRSSWWAGVSRNVPGRRISCHASLLATSSVTK